MKLTDAVIKRLKAPAGGYVVHYDQPAGFGLRVTAGGVKAFIFNYRVRGSRRERRITLGRFPSWSTTGARAEAMRLRRLVDQGGDPLGDFELDRSAPTVADLIERFMAEHVTPYKRPETARGYRALLAKHVRPHFGKHVRVAEVQFSDINALHRKITRAGTPYAANRVMALLSKMFALSVRWEMRSDNPARGVEHNPEVKRKRYLSSAELTALTAALAAHPDRKVANIVRVLLLTGARAGEVYGMRWDELDLGKGIWSKPGSTTKQKTDHVVPLSAPARQLLAEIRARQTGAGVYVFPGKSKTGHMNAIERSWATICKRAGITGLRMHDLRHSFASQLASAGASLPLIGSLLGHSNPTTTHRYAHLFDDPMRKAVETVGAIVDNAGKDAAAPVDIKGGRRGP
jgi:integrase